MAEFKLKRGQKVYHIRQFSSLVELARRKLVAPDDPVYVPGIKKWVYANAIHELRPYLQSTTSPGDDIEELPLDFVEPLTESAESNALDIGEDSLDVDLEPENGGDEAASSAKLIATGGVGPSSVVSEWAEDKEGSGGHRAKGTSSSEMDARERGEPFRGSSSTPADGPDPDERREGMPGRNAARAGRSPSPGRIRGDPGQMVSFQDWMDEKARSSGGPSVLSSLEEDATAEVVESQTVNWSRVAILILGALAIVGGILTWVRTTAELEFQEYTPAESVVRKDGVRPTPRPPQPTVAPEPSDPRLSGPQLVVLDARLRTVVNPQLLNLTNFDQAQDRLFGILLNFRIGVTDVKLESLSGDRSRQVRRADSNLIVRLKRDNERLEEQTGLIGLEVGKYISRQKLKLRYLILHFDAEGKGTLTRKVAASVTADYYRAKITLEQFLVSVQAGTVLTSPEGP